MVIMNVSVQIAAKWQFNKRKCFFTAQVPFCDHSIPGSTKNLRVQIQLKGSIHDFKTPDAHAENAGWLCTNHEIVHFWGGSASITVLIYL